MIYLANKVEVDVMKKAACCMFIVSFLVLSVVTPLAVSSPHNPEPDSVAVFNSIYQTPEYPFGFEWDTGDGNQTYNVGWGGDIVTVYVNVTTQCTVYIKYGYCNNMSCYLGEPGLPDDMDFRNMSEYAMGWEMNHLGGTLYSYQLIGDWMLGFPTYPASNDADIKLEYWVYVRNVTSGEVVPGAYHLYYPYWPASSINITANVSKTTLYPGETFWVNGSANYWHRLNWHDNPPAIESDVTVSVNPEYHGNTNATGNFTVEIQASMTPGLYTVNTTVTNVTPNRNATSVFENITLEVVQPIVNVSLNLNTSISLPGVPVIVNGTVNLDDGSIPVGSEVNVSIKETGDYWLVNVTINGTYEVVITSPAIVGDYNVNVTVYNSTYNATGWNETPLTVVAVPLPDLAVANSDISIQGSFIEGFFTHVNVTVHNDGLVTANNALIEISLDGILSVTKTETIPIGGSIIINDIWLVEPGDHNLSVAVDRLDEIEEDSEDNNEAWKLFRVEADYDGDGTPDIEDEDDDNDNYSDEIEIEEGTDPLDDSSTPPDIDGDFIPDSQDNDMDGDDVDNDVDVFPEDPNESSDYDDDGIGDNEDPDDDNDGYLDGEEDPHLRDTDNDGLRNTVDHDDDKDGIRDADDDHPLDTDNDGMQNDEDLDDDDDGILDVDEDVNWNGLWDEDEGETDYLNPDTDGDDVIDGLDFSPLDSEVFEEPSSGIEHIILPIVIFMAAMAILSLLVLLYAPKK